MYIIKKYISFSFSAAALWLFLLLYVTALAQGKTTATAEGAGRTLFGSSTTFGYSVILVIAILASLLISYFVSKIHCYQPKPLDGFWGLVTALIWVAITCASGMAVMYGVALIAEP